MWKKYQRGFHWDVHTAGFRPQSPERFVILYFCYYVHIYIYIYICVIILGFLFFIQTFLKHCKALSTEKYKCYINILLLLLLLLLLLETKVGTTLQDPIMHSKSRRVWLSETPLIPYKPLVPGSFITKSYKNRAEKMWQPQTRTISS